MAVREFVMRALQRDGHDVTAVGDGRAALDAIRTQPFDMLLSDIVMPELDGIALALKVAEEFPQIPILLMTGFAAERQRAHDVDTLEPEVIPKPFTLKQLREAAARTLARGPAAV